MTSSYFLDSDVLFDFLIERTPFFDKAKIVIQLAEIKVVNLYTSPIVVANIYYLLSKKLNPQTARILILEFLPYCGILNTSSKEIKSALISDFTDFEDAVQYYTALNHTEIRGIITRNVKDYKNSKLRVYSPEEFLSIFK